MSEASELPERESMEFDVVVVGAGPAGLAAAIRLKQVAPDLSVVVLEKGSEVGAHILSGAVIDPVGLDALLPDWREETPIRTQVTADRFLWLGAGGSLRLPNLLMPPLMSNHGNYIASLGDVCRWLAEKAEALGVEIFPGFAGAELLYDDDGRGRSASPPATWAIGARRHAEAVLPARHGASRQIHADRGRRARLAGQAAHRALRPRRGSRAAEIRPRHQGTLASRRRQTIGRGWSSIPSAGRSTTRTGGGSFLYHYRRQPGGGRLRRPPQLRQSAPVALRHIPAVQDPPGDPPGVRRRRAARLWRAGDHRGRLAVGAEADLSRRRAGRLRGGLRQRAAHQGQPQRDPVGHARRRSCRRGASRAGRAHDETDRPTRTAWRDSPIGRDLRPVRNVKPLWSRFGTLGRRGARRSRHVAEHDRPFAVRHAVARPARLRGDEARRRTRPIPPSPKPDGTTTFDRLSSVFRRRRQPRRGPAAASAGRDMALQKASEHDVYRRPLGVLLSGRRL